MSRGSDRYYQLALIRVKHPRQFYEFLQRVAPFVERYGHGLERMLSPQAVYGEGVTKPDVVNIVYYDDRAAFDGFHRDRELGSLLRMRDESIELWSASGPSIAENLSYESLGERLDLVEVAQYGSGGEAAYGRYEAEAKPILDKHGYQVERVFQISETRGFPFTPDLVKVAFFASAAAMARAHDDPAHQRLEHELYPQAVAQSLRIVGKVQSAAPEFGLA